MKPPRRDRIGDGMFGPCREVGPISEVLFVMVFFRLNKSQQVLTQLNEILKSKELHKIMKSGLFCLYSK